MNYCDHIDMQKNKAFGTSTVKVLSAVNHMRALTI